MQNITQYSDQELSLVVFNDEYFYTERDHNGNADYLMALIEEEFVYTPDQLAVLMEDLEADKQEG